MSSNLPRTRDGPSAPVIRRLAAVAPLAAALPLLAACGSEPSSDMVVTDSAGIRIVSNVGPDVPLEWRFEREYLLGGRDSGPESFFDVDASSVGTDSAGNLYVLDRGAFRVVVFDGDGRHLRTLGREGQGPGELAIPLGLAVKPDGTVLVDDLGKGRLVGFTPDGAPLDTEERTLPGSRRVFWGGRHYSGIVTPEEDGMLHRFLAVGGTDTTDLAVLREPVEDRVVEFPSCGMSFSGMPPIFGPDIRWDAWRERAVSRSGSGYEVEVYEEGRRVAIVRRPVEATEATPGLAQRNLGEAMTVMTSAGERRCDPAEVVERRGFADVLPAIREVRVDPSGRIWAGRAGPRPEPTPTDLLAADGTYLGTLPETAPFPVGFLPDGRLLVTETDDLGATRLGIYGVEEVPSGFEPE